MRIDKFQVGSVKIPRQLTGIRIGFEAAKKSSSSSATNNYPEKEQLSEYNQSNLINDIQTAAQKLSQEEFTQHFGVRSSKEAIENIQKDKPLISNDYYQIPD